MQKLFDFYQDKIGQYTEKAEKVQRYLKVLSFSRLGLFVIMLLLVYLLRNEVKVASVVAVLCVVLFLVLVSHYENVKTKYRLLHALVKINTTETKVLRHEFSDLSPGSEYTDARHAYSEDLDLFGQGSFFQYLNRTVLHEGQGELAQRLTANDIDAITAKQETIDELAQMPEWRQDFTAKAMLVQQKVRIAEITDWLSGYEPFVPKSMRFLPWLFLMLTVFVGIMVFKGGWPESVLVFSVLLGLGITGRYFRRIMQLATRADTLKAIFKEYGKLLTMIEQTDFKAAQLRFHKQKLLKDTLEASETIEKFYRLLNTMDYNNNFIYAILGNGCFLGALHTAYQIEKWISRHKNDVAEWFGVIALFDAYNSLGNFSFNHPLYSYPIVQESNKVLVCEGMGHPLIPQDKNVLNDFSIDQKAFFIITGSNMAGKSTFLRSAGLMVVMANIGLPVCATQCLYSPIKLVTSMRSIDSLSKGDSYFLSELKRLKMVIEHLEKEHYFVVLDEILKGTNSTDKAEGSKRFLRRLVGAGATGLIATHDLSLCTVAEQLPQIQNYYLDATIKDDELYFDYRLKIGVSKTMNASFLLEKMKLV
ncbi:DNA mismatch repair protein MutS [Allomuricauda sp. d1]|uniref:MutS-related protein n=1 Tax=Allomuricauda sp. d1 TaxID=3136725 RepID=UPI0031E139F4